METREHEGDQARAVLAAFDGLAGRNVMRPGARRHQRNLSRREAGAVPVLAGTGRALPGPTVAVPAAEHLPRVARRLEDRRA